MGKKQVFKKNSEKYNELCHMFCTKFVETFGQMSGLTYQDVEELFRQRIKKIRIGDYINCYDGKKIRIVSDYSSLGQAFEHVFTHEALHAISAQHKRRIFPLSLKSIIFKKTSDFPVEEGLTEYYTCCMEKTEKTILTNPTTRYRQEAMAMELMGNLINPQEMMNFYLKNDQTFIKSINHKIPQGYAKLKEILSRIDGTLGPAGFQEFSLHKLSPIRELFEQNLLPSVNSLETFKESVDLLLEIYSQDIYALSSTMHQTDALFKNETDETQRTILIQRMNRDKQRFERLKTILKTQWIKLGIDDEALFNEIVMTKIKEKCPNAYSAVAFSNVFPNLPKKTPETTKDNSYSYTFTNNQSYTSNEYVQEETVSQGRGR